MPDHRHQLTQLLDHPQADAERAAQPAFTAAVMARLHSAERLPASRSRLLPWYLAAIALAAGVLVPGSWLGEVGDPSLLLDSASSADSLDEIVIATLAGGALLLVRRRSVA